MAAWLLIGFGLAYAIWSLLRERKKGAHLHLAPDPSAERKRRRVVTVWSLFIVFVLGPCEPLIPILMAPAFDHMWTTVVGVVLVFALVTIGTMCVLVTIERVTVRVATAALAHTLQLAVYLFVYDGRPVDSLLPRQIRTSFGQAVKGTMPLTFYIVGGRVPKHRASEAQDAAVEWVLAAWRHHRQVCGP